MSYLLGTSQPDDPVGYWLKPSPHADVACLVVRVKPDGLLRAACGTILEPASATQGRRGVKLCLECVARVREKVRRRAWSNGSERRTAQPI